MKSGTNSYGEVYIPGVQYQDLPRHCPQLALIYGQGSLNAANNSVSLHIDAAVCSPVVYQVMVNATFIMPDFQISSLEADDSTKRVLEIGQNATLPLYAYLTPTNWNVNGFFGGLAPGRDGLSWSDLIGDSNFSRFSQHVDHLYSIIYSQWLNLNGRVSPDNDHRSASTVITDPLRMRLKQSVVSTRILEALLAAIAVLMAVAFFLMDTRTLLPFNPCSIGATAALLAESEILKTIPEGAEWWDNREMAKKRVFSDYLFSLGWWEGIGGTKRFGVDVGSAERANDR